MRSKCVASVLDEFASKLVTKLAAAIRLHTEVAKALVRLVPVEKAFERPLRVPAVLQPVRFDYASLKQPFVAALKK